MYNEHFGLKQAPFRITPDTRLFYSGGGRGGVLDALVYAITSGEGIIKVVGEVGSGKTMLCRMLEERLPERVEIVYLANPSLTPDDILQAIALEMNLEVPGGANRLQVMHALQQRLVEKHAQNRQVVIFVEEAQSMPIETLEEIRLLSNLETKREKLLQIVLFGQPELDENLDQANIRQLRERITHSFYLEPFSRDELQEYVNFRMRAVGYRGPDVFHSGAYHSLARASEGLTRRINILADKALLAAFADDRHNVNKKHVRKAIVDSQFERRRADRAPEITLALGILMVVGAIGWTFFGPGQPPLTATTTATAPEAGTASAALSTVAPDESTTARTDSVQTVAALAPAAGEVSAAANENEPSPQSPPAEADASTPDPSSSVSVEAAEPVDAAVNAKTGPTGASPVTPLVAEAETEPATPALAEAADQEVRVDSPVAVATAPVAAEMAKRAGESEETAANRTLSANSDAAETGELAAAVEVRGQPVALLEQRIEVTRGWLRNTDGAHYSIQLLLTSRNQRRSLESFLERQSRSDGFERLYVYETIINDRPYIGVLYGDFPTLTAAREALENLPAALKRLGPFIRNVSDISTVG